MAPKWVNRDEYPTPTLCIHNQTLDFLFIYKLPRVIYIIETFLINATATGIINNEDAEGEVEVPIPFKVYQKKKQLICL